ncbi:MAG: serine/threonine protein kinase [Myxococcales bacterium]|nr:serine/threonine protein kinase [Myxococcales bacterium]
MAPQPKGPENRRRPEPKVNASGSSMSMEMVLNDDIGRTLASRYQITRVIGEGGMGVVYEAEHIDIDRKVALKILRFDLSQEPKMAQVFRDEARAASRVGSKNIVEIYDFGELSDGRLFFCMELIPGGDLVPATEDDWIEPPRLIGLLRQICKGLAAAHKAGIIHRDIKPENIIIVNEEGREVVKIVDFGISAMVAAAGGKGGGTIAGTPHYMAPEQISGEEFDGRLDIYALGCVLYYMVTSRPVFNERDAPSLLRAHVEREPTPPSEQLSQPLPYYVETVIMRCLAKDPKLRYQNVEALVRAIDLCRRLHDNDRRRGTTEIAPKVRDTIIKVEEWSDQGDTATDLSLD